MSSRAPKFITGLTIVVVAVLIALFFLDKGSPTATSSVEVKSMEEQPPPPEPNPTEPVVIEDQKFDSASSLLRYMQCRETGFKGPNCRQWR